MKDNVFRDWSGMSLEELEEMQAEDRLELLEFCNRWNFLRCKSGLLQLKGECTMLVRIETDNVMKAIDYKRDLINRQSIEIVKRLGPKERRSRKAHFEKRAKNSEALAKLMGTLFMDSECDLNIILMDAESNRLTSDYLGYQSEVRYIDLINDEKQ